MQIYSTTYARKHLGELLNQVKYTGKVIALGRHDRAEALLVSLPQDGEIPISSINAQSPSFAFLQDEPDIYSRDDLKKRYV